MKKIFTIILMLHLFSNFSFSQDTNTIKFFPLKIGNVWVYQKHSEGSYCAETKKRRIKIINSININSYKYFLFSDTTRLIYGGGNCPDFGKTPFDTLRIDSMNGNIYKYSYQGCSYLNHEIIVDSLKVHLNDTVKILCGNTLSPYYCLDTSLHSFFGVMRQYRDFRENDFEGGYGRSFAKNIGEVGYSCYATYGNSSATLLGCVLDGVLYGDTSFITGITQTGYEIPTDFSLFQNYPNPFNPTTKIKFEVAEVRDSKVDVRLVVYDILGREVATLVNEKLSPGTYQVEWNATDYPSGVYFYKLTTTNYSATKKLVLLK